MKLPGTAKFLTMFCLCAVARISIARTSSDVSSCPDEYPRDGIVLTKIPQGWTGEVDERLLLQSAGITVGAPSYENEIIPTQSRKTRNGSEVIYDDLIGFPKQRWIMCGYGPTNNVKLYRKLEPGVNRCTMHYAVMHAGTKVERLDGYRCD
jgi:hypothetical protein